MIFVGQGTLSTFFTPPCTIKVKFEDQDHKSTIQLEGENGMKETLYLFIGSEGLKGNVEIDLQAGKQIEHKGIVIELIGQIGLSNFNTEHFWIYLKVFVCLFFLHQNYFMIVEIIMNLCLSCKICPHLAC